MMYIAHMYHIAEKFYWKIISSSPASCLCIVEIFSGINFLQHDKGCYILYVIIKFRQQEHVVKLVKIFSWQKFLYGICSLVVSLSVITSTL